MSALIPIRNDVDFRAYGFRDSRAAKGTYLNAASTATWEIRTAKSPGGSQVASGNLSYVSGSNGEYVGGPGDDVALVEGTSYYAHLVLVEGDVRVDVEFLITGSLRTGRTPTA